MSKPLESAPDRANNAVHDARGPGESIEDLETLEVVERRHVMRVLRAVDDNKTLAARVLGIGRKTLYRMLERWRASAQADAILDDGRDHDDRAPR